MITITMSEWERLIRFTLFIGMNLGLNIVGWIILWINESSPSAPKEKKK